MTATIYSAKSRSVSLSHLSFFLPLPNPGCFVAFHMLKSITVMNRNEERMHPSLTPETISTNSVYPVVISTQQLELLCNALKILLAAQECCSAPVSSTKLMVCGHCQMLFEIDKEKDLTCLQVGQSLWLCWVMSLNVNICSLHKQTFLKSSCFSQRVWSTASCTLSLQFDFVYTKFLHLSSDWLERSSPKWPIMCPTGC